MDDANAEHDPNDYPDPGASSRNPYPAITQPTWGPYGSVPGVNAGDYMALGDLDKLPAYPDIDDEQSIGPYDIGNEYSQLAEQFHMQHGTPRRHGAYHFPGATAGLETDAEGETDAEPMANPYYDTELIRRAEAVDGGEYIPTEDDGSDDDDDDDDDDAEFEANFSNALDAISEDEMAISAVTKPGRGRPRGRPRGSARGRGRGRGWKWALKGTAHDPKLQKDQEKRRGRPSGPRTGPLAKKSKRRQRAEDPGPVFKKLQEQATGAFLSGQLDTALDLARHAVMTNPEIYVAHSLLSDILIAKGNQKDALGALMTGANIKKDPDLWLLVANKTLEMAGSFRTKAEYDQAVFCFSKAIHFSHGEDTFEIRTRRRDLHLDCGHDVKARIDTRYLLRSRPDDLDNLKLYAELCLESKDLTEIAAGRETYEETFKNFSENDTFGDAESQWAHLNMYLDLVDMTKEPAYAISELKRIARWFLGRKDDEYWDQVVEDDREFDTDHGRRNDVAGFRDGVKLDPESYGDGLPLDLRVKMGMFRLKMSDHDEGLRHFEYIYELRDDITNVYDLFFSIGDTLRLRGMFADAIRFYKPIEVLEDELTDQYWIALAACYRGLKNFIEAEKCYRAVVDMDANHAAARAELARMLAEDMDEKDKAYAIVRDLITMGRKDIIRKERLPVPPVNPRASARKEKLLEKKRKRGHPVLVDVPEIEDTLARKRLKQRSVARSRELKKRVAERAENEGVESGSDDEDDDANAPGDNALATFKKRAFAEILKKEDDRDRFFEEQAERILSCFARVKELWHVLDDDKADEEEVFDWMDNARVMYREFRTMRVFYPSRDRYKPFKGFEPTRIRNRNSKFLRDLEILKKKLEDGGAQEEAPESESENEGNNSKKNVPPPMDVSTPTDFHGITFSTWHHIFVDLALSDAKQSDQESCYEIIENGLFNANVFYHNEDLLNTSQATSICCALMFNDSERLIKTARWFATRGDLRSGSSYQLITAVSRLAYGDNTWFTAGPTQKFMLRSVKTLDYQALPPAMRRKYDFGMPASTLRRRNKPELAADGLDAGALLNYGHMVSVANHSSSALPYFFRAFALKPDDPGINLSIASQYVSGAMKRQTNNRHHEIHQGLSFLYRYYDIRTRDGVPAQDQEAEYNVARMWHVLGLTYLAIPAYEKVLALSARVQSDIESKAAVRKTRLDELEASRLAHGEGGTVPPKSEKQEATRLLGEEKHGLGLEDYATEAAYALQAIYVAVGNQRAAQSIGEKWLVL